MSSWPGGPRGLLTWALEIGVSSIFSALEIGVSSIFSGLNELTPISRQISRLDNSIIR